MEYLHRTQLCNKQRLKLCSEEAQRDMVLRSAVSLLCSTPCSFQQAAEVYLTSVVGNNSSQSSSAQPTQEEAEEE